MFNRKKTFTTLQFNSLEKVLVEWKQKYKKATILGHSQATQTHKTCPNFNIKNGVKKDI